MKFSAFLLSASSAYAATCTYDFNINIQDAGSNPDFQDVKIHYFDGTTLIGKAVNRYSELTTGYNLLTKIDSAITCTGCVWDGRVSVMYNGDSSMILDKTKYIIGCKYSTNPRVTQDAYFGYNWGPVTTGSCPITTDFEPILSDWEFSTGDKCIQDVHDDYCTYEFDVYLDDYSTRGHLYT